jgi:hypothetical protein
MARWQAWKSLCVGALFAGFLSSNAMAADPVLSFTASPANPAPGGQVTLSFNIAAAVDLYAYQFSVNFNPAVLRAVSGAQGSFLTSVGPTSFGPGVINNTTGVVDVVYASLFGTGPGATGSGTLATLTFNVIAAGTSPITFSDTLFLNSALNTITTQLVNGTVVAAIPEPSAALLLAAGLVGVGAMRLRKARAA